MPGLHWTARQYHGHAPGPQQHGAPLASVTSVPATDAREPEMAIKFYATDYREPLLTWFIWLLGRWSVDSARAAVSVAAAAPPGVAGTPDAYGRKIRQEIDLWSRIVKDNQIKTD